MSLTPFLKTAELIEARASGNRATVIIRASTPARDRQNESFLAEAWSYPEDRAYFLKEGVIDYNHLSRLIPAKFKKAHPSQVNESERARMDAIIGEPRTLETDGDDLICEADLYRNNEYVKSLLPALEADSTRFGASVAGFAFTPSEKTKSLHGPGVFDRARLDHIAICPLKESINNETSVTLIKSAMNDSLGIGHDDQAAAVAGPPGGGLDDALIREFAITQPGFKDFIYARLKSQMAERLDYEFALDYFRRCGFEPDESRQLATRALIHFGRMQ